MNKISVIIPVYNVEKYLSACIESIINQTYRNLEIILVDDGSTDCCPKICDDYAAKDSRIKVRHKENGGLSDARNVGIEVATGEYIAFVDSDDLITLNFCEILLQTALQNRGGIVECSFAKFENEFEINWEQLDSKSIDLVYQTEEALELLIKDTIKQTVWNKLYKKEIIDGVLFEKNRKHEDEFWTYQVIGKAKRIVKNDNVLYFYRQHPESIMGQGYSLQRLDGLDALEERILFMQRNYPQLFHLSFKSFWSASSAHYQNLTQNSNLDQNGLHRKRILRNLKKYKTEISDKDFKLKDLFWLHFFLLMPNIYSKFRNYIKVGV
ncbi:glycosyltransferase [Chryseobacterium sp. MDT2-18]|uniref:glycosyltransferase family 2 protein n=1 Tax=Chryseobacterium sp. MDT2-18 TaxID=1259136 RepID=UPI002788CC1F|nr:glycosyltransferase [Chryseobacterium sp. MDT2-18]MDQ0478172.1 glycosyltransferase involved in cell wall biosynthesis [Chryseobacterium sp. MDT2-18]